MWCCRGLLLLLPGAAAAAVGWGEPQQVTVELSDTVISQTLEEYLSVDIDWWHNTTHDCAPAQGRECWGNAGALWLDLTHPRLRAAAAALSPGLLRIGGSLDDHVKYLVGGMTAAECHAEFGPFKGQMWPGLCLNTSRWDALHTFARDAGLGMVFGLGYPNPQRWDSENALALLEYTARSNQSLFGVELGEEMAPSPGTAAFEGLVEAYSNLRKGVEGIRWPQGKPPLILGPCVGMHNEEPGLGFAFTRAFLKRTLGAGTLDAVVMHSYNNDGGDDWARPGFLGQTLEQAETMLAATRASSPTTPLWCGECGPHNAGGLPNVTDTFMSSFWYADALAGLAKLGLAQFGRQALVGGNYALLQEHTFSPNPDFFTAMAWKQLMGTEVLNVTHLGAGEPATLRVYAHCESARHHAKAAEARDRAVTLLLINVDPETQFDVTVGGAAGAARSREEWHLTAPSGDMRSRTALLNGKPLAMGGDGQLPALVPRDGPDGTPIGVAPLSIAFVVLPSRRCPLPPAA